MTPTGAPDYFKRILLYGVDEDGNPVAGLVDDAGRFIMIPTDAPDAWGQAIHTGLAELAACQGPAKRFDRRGDVVWIDSFEYGLDKWKTSVDCAEAAVAMASDKARTGGHCVKLTTGDDGACYARIDHHTPRPASNRVGLEFSFALDGYVDYISAKLELFTGTEWLIPGVRFNQVDETIQYVDDANDWVDLATGVDIRTGTHTFWTAKLVVDFATRQYVRLLMRHTEYDMSDLSFYASDDEETPQMRVRIQAVGLTGATRTAYVDDVIITQNEPE